jgi:hypothetical protein
MAIAHAMWAHGHSLQIETAGRGKVERKGFSAKYISQGGGLQNWLHFAIPTAVIVNGDRLRATSAMIRFRCGGGGRVKAIHVYDGEVKIAARDNLNLGPGQWHLERVDVPGGPEVKWGLGISILVDFGPDDRWVEFSAAGCDLLS